MWEGTGSNFGSLMDFLSLSTRMLERYTMAIANQLRPPIAKPSLRRRSCYMSLAILSHVSVVVEASSLQNLTVSHQMAHLMCLQIHILYAQPTIYIKHYFAH
jgi:hypothetical protein